MRSQKDQVWYHVDVNSAYLSWTAAYRVCILGEDLDLRDLPSVISGSEYTSSAPEEIGIKRAPPMERSTAFFIIFFLLIEPRG